MRWLAVLVVMAGCSSEAQFENRFPKRYCSYYAQCSPDAMVALYESEVGCVDAQERWLVDYKLCTYDEVAGSACLDALTNAECGEFANSVLSMCSEVIYDCE